MLKTVARFLLLPVAGMLIFSAIIRPVTAGETFTANGLQGTLQKGTLLVAGKRLIDPNFEQSVILLTRHNERGSTGIIINRRSSLPLEQAFPELVKLLPILQHLYYGGPVAGSRVSLLIQSGQPIDSANEVIAGIYHIDRQVQFRGLNLDNLDAGKTRLFSGYAGWSPGQLQAEIQRGDWHTWPAKPAILFSETPGDMWTELIELAAGKWVFRGDYLCCPGRAILPEMASNR